MRWLVVVGLVVLAAVVLPAKGAQKIVDHDFIGADRCRSCHAQAYAVWERSAHARAYDVLSPRDRTDPRCLTCHTLVADDASAGLLGVQCESCHGAGRHYAVDWVMRDEELRSVLGFKASDAASCTRCHTDTSPSMLPFDAKAKLEAIRHWP
jgi:hypothetical protein